MTQLNIFQIVKQSVTTRQAALFYGLHINRNGMCCCPFHNDRNPSMKLDDRFHCFGCGADGDVIDFVCRLLNLAPKEAAYRLIGDFNLSIPTGYHNSITSLKNSDTVFNKQPQSHHNTGCMPDHTVILFNQQLKYVFRVYCDYLHLLEKWMIQYAPDAPDVEYAPQFIEAAQKIPITENLLDCILFGSDQDRANIVIEKGKEVKHLEERITKATARKTHSAAESACSFTSTDER